jgi:O-antigen/teichoic acid export membrane protein
MDSILKRLAGSGVAFQASSLLAGLLALFTLPLYTRSLTAAEFGYAETLLTLVILTSILLRAGLGEAFIRHWHEADGAKAQSHLVRTTTGFVLITSTLALVVGLVLAEPLSHLVFGTSDATLMSAGVFGIWAFTNLEMAYALLRISSRRRAYLIASSANVILTVALTLTLVVLLDEGARGYVLGNYVASSVILVGLWIFVLREHIGIPRGPLLLGPLLRYGAPTIPADAAVFLLNVIDRAYLLRADSPSAAGLYSVAVKLATAVIILVRAFQLAWPPLAYSIVDDQRAQQVYARVTTAYMIISSLLVAAFTLLGAWLVRLLTAPDFFSANEALPWLALGWALYGLYLVLVTIAGRAKVTVRTLPAAAAGLVVNVGLLIWLVPPLGVVGAAISLCVAYVAMLVVLFLLTRNVFTVPFEWSRLIPLVIVVATFSVGGELLLPSDGAEGFVLRAAVLLAIVPALIALRVVTIRELNVLIAAFRSGRAAESG